MLQHSCVCLYLFSPPVPSSNPVTVTTSKAKVEVHENTSKLLSLQIISWTCLKAFELTLYLFFAKDAVLSCEFRTEKETNPRVEWKKRGKDVSYVYFDGDFTGGLLFCPFQNVLQPIFISLDILWNLLSVSVTPLVTTNDILLGTVTSAKFLQNFASKKGPFSVV